MKALTVRVPEDLHEEANELFEELGLNMTVAVNVFLRQCVVHRGIPFEISLWPMRRGRGASGSGDEASPPKSAAHVSALGPRVLPYDSCVDPAAVPRADRPELEMRSVRGRVREPSPVLLRSGGVVKKSIIGNLVPGGVGGLPRLPSGGGFPNRVRGAPEAARGHALHSVMRKANSAFSAKKLFSADIFYLGNGSRGRESLPNCPLDAQLPDGL